MTLMTTWKIMLKSVYQLISDYLYHTAQQHEQQTVFTKFVPYGKMNIKYYLNYKLDLTQTTCTLIMIIEWLLTIFFMWIWKLKLPAPKDNIVYISHRKMNKYFFSDSETTTVSKHKLYLYMKDLWMVLYTVCILDVDRKFKMATYMTKVNIIYIVRT